MARKRGWKPSFLTDEEWERWKAGEEDRTRRLFERVFRMEAEREAREREAAAREREAEERRTRRRRFLPFL